MDFDNIGKQFITRLESTDDITYVKLKELVQSKANFKEYIDLEDSEYKNLEIV